ncbi:acyltransferase family protein [Paraglaciecola sp. 2405UD69-4]|uniref:acyltransferase family protein n=1 Tax=Paraglaciecola sp. 2405UD69-4 TaxID=3391836 RepID=UPI0039C97CD2
MFGIYRFVLALNVMIFHILQVPTIGPLAVYSFFILSGFLMTIILHENYGYSINGFKAYVINRFLRLYPTYWFLLIIIVLIIYLVGVDFASESHSKMQLPTNLSEWLANIGMMFIQFNPVEYSPRLSPPTWALTIELFFYILIGLGVSKNKGMTWFWFIASALYVLTNNIFSGKLGTGYGNILDASLPFSIGALLFFYHQTLFSLAYKIPHGRNLAILVFILNVLLAPITKAFVPELYQSHGWKIEVVSTWLNLPLSALMTILLFNIRSQNKTLKLIDIRLGDYSYPLYIFHTGAACLASWLYFKIGLVSGPEHTLPVFLVALAITLGVSQLSENMVNNKINKLRKRIKSGTS